MKIYLSIPSCIFVLGLDWQNIKRAVAAELLSTGIVGKENRDEALIQAADYLNKLCQTVYPLPLLASPVAYLRNLMQASVFQNPDNGQLDARWIDTMLRFDLLPRNPRKIKAFANGLALYLTQLRPVLDAAGKDLDVHLALIVAYLKLNEDRVFRILESRPGFWNEMVRFCRLADAAPDIHEVFHGRALPDTPHIPAAAVLGEEWNVAEYTPAFTDPADGRVFRAAPAIRAWQAGNPPTNDEFIWYLHLRTE